jgi:sorting nexin-9/18/33
MQQSSNSEPSSPLTPPAATRGYLSFAWAQGQAAQSKREVPGSPPLDFDASINTSTAWTEHLDSDSSRSRSLSDDDDEDEDDQFEEGIDGRGARVLFAFAGNAESRELDVKAGDEITIIREEAGDEWSLARTRRGRVGLLPRSHYTVNPFLLYRLCPPLTSSSSLSTSSPPPMPVARCMHVTLAKADVTLRLPR